MERPDLWTNRVGLLLSAYFGVVFGLLGFVLFFAPWVDGAPWREAITLSGLYALLMAGIVWLRFIWSRARERAWRESAPTQIPGPPER